MTRASAAGTGSDSSAAKPHRLAELAGLSGCEVVGDPDALVLGVADPSEAGPGDMVFLVEPRFHAAVSDCPAGFVLSAEPLPGRNGLIARRPREAMARVLAAFEPAPPAAGVAPGALVDPAARLGPGVSVGPGAVIGTGAVVGRGTVIHANVVLYPEVRVGSHCILHAGVIVRERCVLGDRVVVQPGAVIGSDGFGFVPGAQGNLKIPQLGDVRIEDDVEIGANCTIDRATLGHTVVGKGTKLDNLVHLAHNVQVGERCLLVAQVGISGSTRIGDRCVFGGQSGAVGHIHIASGVTVAAKSGVTKDTAGGQTVSGFPARPHREELRRLAQMDRLARRLERVEAALARLAGGPEASA